MFKIFQKKPTIAVLGKEPGIFAKLSKEVTKGNYKWKRYDSLELANSIDSVLIIEFLSPTTYHFPKTPKPYSLFSEFDVIPYNDNSYGKLLFNLNLSKLLENTHYFSATVNELLKAYVQDIEQIDFITNKATLELLCYLPYTATNQNEVVQYISEINTYYLNAIDQYNKPQYRQSLIWEFELFKHTYEENKEEFIERLTLLLSIIDSSKQPYEFAYIKYYQSKLIQESNEGKTDASLFEKQIIAFQEIKSLIDKDKHNEFFADVLYDLGNTYTELLKRNYLISTIDKGIVVFEELIPILDKTKNYKKWLHTNNAYANAFFLKSTLIDDLAHAKKALKLYTKLKYEFNAKKSAWDYAMYQQNCAAAAIHLAKLADSESATKLITIALELCENALKIWTYDNHPIEHALVLLNIAKARAQEGKTKKNQTFYLKAIDLIKRVIKINTEEGIHNELSKNYRILSIYYYEAAELLHNLENYQKSVKYIKVSVDLLKNSTEVRSAFSAYYYAHYSDKLATVTKKEEDYIEAVKAAEAYISLKSSDTEVKRYYYTEIRHLYLLSMLTTISLDPVWKQAYLRLCKKLEKMEFEDVEDEIKTTYHKMISDIINAN
ncbi:hypothetical protein [Maribacter sp. Asnod1-A12]|uniref:hypothetical protein n=1 Tax=Maribacter sp. Asnod1-A12 TaxID=3160576 RepID=UPI00386F47CF